MSAKPKRETSWQSAHLTLYIRWGRPTPETSISGLQAGYIQVNSAPRNVTALTPMPPSLADNRCRLDVVAALGLSRCPRSDWSCSLARPPCGASPRRQFHHPIVEQVGDVEVA